MSHPQAVIPEPQPPIDPEQEVLLAIGYCQRNGSHPGRAVSKSRIAMRLRSVCCKVNDLELDQYLGNLLSAGKVRVAAKLWSVALVCLLVMGCDSQFSTRGTGPDSAGSAGAAGSSAIAIEAGSAGAAGSSAVFLEAGSAGAAGADISGAGNLHGGAGTFVHGAGGSTSRDCPACGPTTCGYCTTPEHPSCLDPVFVYCF